MTEILNKNTHKNMQNCKTFTLVKYWGTKQLLFLAKVISNWLLIKQSN